MNGKRKEAPPTNLEFELAGRSNFLRIDLDAILHNVGILRSKCSPHTGLVHSVTQSFIGLSWTSFYTRQTSYENAHPHTGLVQPVTQSFIGLSWTSFYTRQTSYENAHPHTGLVQSVTQSFTGLSWTSF